MLVYLKLISILPHGLTLSISSTHSSSTAFISHWTWYHQCQSDTESIHYWLTVQNCTPFIEHFPSTSLLFSFLTNRFIQQSPLLLASKMATVIQLQPCTQLLLCICCSSFTLLVGVHIWACELPISLRTDLVHKYTNIPIRTCNSWFSVDKGYTIYPAIYAVAVYKSWVLTLRHS